MSSPFIKRAPKSRLANIRQRAAEDDLDGTSSPLASSSLTADDHVSSSSMPGVKASSSRRERYDNDSEDLEEAPSFSPMQLAAQNRRKEKDRSKRKGLLGSAIAGSSSRSRLSFGLEGEGAASNEGASSEAGNSSRRKLGLGLGSSALAGPSSAPASVAADTASPSGSTYTSAYLEELKASTPSRAAPSRSAQSDLVSGDDVDGILTRDSPGPSSLPPADGMIVQDTTAGIPDEALIASAKAKRAAAAGGVGPSSGGIGSDFVRLSDSRPISKSLAIYDDSRAGPHPESRLQREEDELGDGDEDLAAYTEQDLNLAIGKKANKTAARRLKSDMAELIDEREAEAGVASEDEDAMEWERAQVERANVYGSGPAEAESSRRKPYKPAPMPAARPLPSVAAASARLLQTRAQLESSRQSRLAHIDTNERDLVLYDQQEQELRKEVAKVEAKREWMEEFKGWVETLGGFLEEKVCLPPRRHFSATVLIHFCPKMPILDSIEDDMAHHYTERTEMIKKRRRDDDRDDLALFCGVASVEQDNDGNGNGRPTGHQEDLNPHAGVRRHRREARQQRRQRRRAMRPTTQEDGYSTDSTLGEADAEDYEAAQQILADRVQSLSDDVKAEDFRDPVVGLASRFAGWRKQYEDEYLTAYGGLAMVQAWEYWARKEMVGWEPARVCQSQRAHRVIDVADA